MEKHFILFLDVLEKTVKQNLFLFKKKTKKFKGKYNFFQHCKRIVET